MAVAITSAPMDSRAGQPPAPGVMSAPQSRSGGGGAIAPGVGLFEEVERLCVQVGDGLPVVSGRGLAFLKPAASLWMGSIGQRRCLCLGVSYLILGHARPTCAYLAQLIAVPREMTMLSMREVSSSDDVCVEEL